MDKKKTGARLLFWGSAGGFLGDLLKILTLHLLLSCQLFDEVSCYCSILVLILEEVSAHGTL